jgi:hypothetical protein
MGGAIHYTATHPGASFDRAEYLSTVLRWGAWGGFAGAGYGALFYGGSVVLGTTTVRQLFSAGVTTGMANVIVTGIDQGGYRDLPQVEDAFLSGFYTGYGISLTTNWVASTFKFSNSTFWKSVTSGVVGSGYGAMAKGENAPEEIVTNFTAFFLFGLTSPSISDTSNKLAYVLMGTTPRAAGLYPPVLFARDYLAQGMGYAFSSLAVTAIKPSVLKFYRRKIPEAGQWFITH